jgi:SAM-dependent methyltransferase
VTARLDESRSATRLAFDRLAVDYDTLTSGEIFQLLRARTHRVFARSFAQGSCVLEIGCGTGADTQFLATRGVRVVACDPSEEMVSRTMRRLAREGLDRDATVVPCGLEDLQFYLAALDLPDQFDGIVSNFGAMNCVPHLAPLAALVRRHLAPGGVVILGLMSRVCALEAVYFTATKRPELARRRLGSRPVSVPVGGIDVPTYYHRIKDVCEALARDARLVSIAGIGVTIPPPYLEPRWQALPRPVRSLATTVDGWLAHWPPFNRIGDHVLLLFTKEGAHA